MTTVTDPLVRITTFGFDADNRQTSAQAPNPVGGGTGGPTQSVEYDALGDVIKSFDSLGNETDYTYNARGWVLTVTGPAPTVGGGRPVTTYTYNGDDHVLTETDPLGRVTSYVYDSFGRLTQETLPDPDGAGSLTSPVLHWAYDADGNLTSYTDALGNVTAYSYDDRNRQSQAVQPSPGGVAGHPTTSYVYDDAGELIQVPGVR